MAEKQFRKDTSKERKTTHYLMSGRKEQKMRVSRETVNFLIWIIIILLWLFTITVNIAVHLMMINNKTLEKYLIFQNTLVLLIVTFYLCTYIG